MANMPPPDPNRQAEQWATHFYPEEEQPSKLRGTDNRVYENTAITNPGPRRGSVFRTSVRNREMRLTGEKVAVNATMRVQPGMVVLEFPDGIKEVHFTWPGQIWVFEPDEEQ